MQEIINASFITSAPNVKLSPENDYQNEVVFMARSNVGKSSLLNSLTNRKSLAKVSSTPGKTKLINFFDVDFIDRENEQKSHAVFVDLPGFGYAKVSKSIHAEWGKTLTDFIESRKNIRLFVHLVDARHPDLEIDASVSDFLDEIVAENQVVLKVYTKIDKLNQKERSALLRLSPGALMISNTKQKGIDRLTQQIASILFHEETADDTL